jgi:CheY-like chemotaxis protein
MARILLIEDNRTNLELLTYLLKSFGHTCIEALDGVEGLKKADSERPDLIICDIQLPSMDGYGVAKQLKSNQALSPIPVVAVSSYAMLGEREKALAVGFDKFISKPIEPETFVQEIEACLRECGRKTEET